MAYPVVELLSARDVPLGGLRAMTVRRTLPQRARSTIGAWCFIDQFGPGSTQPMQVLPHPHTGLQTVTWPIAGEIHHRDSLGSDVVVRPGELNLMTAGTGVSHSEFSDEAGAAVLAGVQLWAALGDGGIAPSFQQVRQLPHALGPGWDATVLVGALHEAVSPAVVHTPLLGADVSASSDAEIELTLQPGYEHGVLVLDGAVEIDPGPGVGEGPGGGSGGGEVGAGVLASGGVLVQPGPLAYLGTGREVLRLRAHGAARFLLLGGEPFTEPLVMFWNFVGRDHDQVAQARADWEADATLPLGDPRRRFGTVAGHATDRIPAPVVPAVRLRPRSR